MTFQVSNLIGDYHCNQCGRPVFYNSSAWLHSDDLTPADQCTGYPHSNVTLLDDALDSPD